MRVDDVYLKQARVEVWSLQKGEMFLFHVDTLLPRLAPFRVKSLRRSWSQLCLQVTLTLVCLQQNYFQVVISPAKCTQNGLFTFLVCVGSPFLLLAALLSLPSQETLQILAKSKVTVKLWAPQVGYEVIWAQVTDAVAAAEQLIAHTRISMFVCHVEPL